MTQDRTGQAKPHPAAVGTLGSLLYHAYVIEAEAEARYLELAEQMETHNNPEVAALFRQLAEYEGKHAEHIGSIRPAAPRPPLNPWDFSWMGNEAPESIPHQSVNYALTPRKALELSLAAEEAAEKFFSNLAEKSDDAEISALARGFADEERVHVKMIKREMAKHPPEKNQPVDDWDEPIDQG